MIRVERDGPESVKVVCDDHGSIVTRAAVVSTALDSALRHDYAHHHGQRRGVRITPEAAARFYPAVRR